jgi:fructose-1,6-bisphosphatase I
MESLSLSIQMACKTISNLVNRNGINSIPPTPQTEISSSNETNDDLRLNSMKRLDEVSTNVLRNALRFTGKLQMVKPAQDPMDGDENVFESGPAEHQPGVLIAQALDDKYVAYFDPLDGSGNADAAICSGTVFGIFETEDKEEED